MTGLRARPWNPRGTDTQWHSAARCTDPRPEPGFAATLAAAVDAHPRFARAGLILAAMALAAVLALYTVKG